jgi:hypothetical protein
MSLGGIEGISGLEISSNEDGWGPVSSSVLKGYEDVPFAHFDKVNVTKTPLLFLMVSSFILIR